MNKHKCEQCGSDMIQLFTSWVCSNECDKKKKPQFREFNSFHLDSIALVPAEQVVNHHALIEKMKEAIIRACGIPKEIIK